MPVALRGQKCPGSQTPMRPATAPTRVRTATLLAQDETSCCLDAREVLLQRFGARPTSPMSPPLLVQAVRRVCDLRDWQHRLSV